MKSYWNPITWHQKSTESHEILLKSIKNHKNHWFHVIKNPALKSPPPAKSRPKSSPAGLRWPRWDSWRPNKGRWCKSGWAGRWLGRRHGFSAWLLIPGPNKTFGRWTDDIEHHGKMTEEEWTQQWDMLECLGVHCWDMMDKVCYLEWEHLIQ